MSKSARARRFPVADRRGLAAIEFAVLGGLFFIVLLAAIDIGRYYMTIQGLRNFAADAARYGTVNMAFVGTGTQTASCADVVRATGRGGAIAGLVSTSPSPCVTRVQATGTGGAIWTVTVTVDIDVTFNFVVNSFGIGSPRFRESTRVQFLL